MELDAISVCDPSQLHIVQETMNGAKYISMLKDGQDHYLLVILKIKIMIWV